MLYFLYLGEATTGPIRPNSCMVGDVPDVITCAKFQIEIFMGYDFTAGRILDFLLIFAWALQQCSVNTLPLIESYKHTSQSIRVVVVSSTCKTTKCYNEWITDLNESLRSTRNLIVILLVADRLPTSAIIVTKRCDT